MPRIARMKFVPVALALAATVSALAASCGSAGQSLDEVARIAQKIAQGIGRNADDSDDLAASMRRIAQSSSADEATIASYADDVYIAGRRSQLVADATDAALARVTSVDSQKIQAYVTGVACSILDKQIAGETIDPFTIASTEAAAVAIPTVQAILLVDTARSIAAQIEGGDLAAAKRRIDLLIHCTRAGLT
jgi:hypothetical protein